MLNKALEAFGDLRYDEELGPADWPTVKRYITCLSNIEEEPSHPHDVPEGDDDVVSLWCFLLCLVCVLCFVCSVVEDEGGGKWNES